MDKEAFAGLVVAAFHETCNGWPAIPIMPVVKLVCDRHDLTVMEATALLEATLGCVGSLRAFEVQRATGEGLRIHGKVVGSLVWRGAAWEAKHGFNRVPAYPLASHVDFDGVYIIVELKDGRKLYVPLEWYQPLRDATDEQREDWRLIGDGYGIHWESLNEDLSILGLLLPTHARA